MRSVQRLIMSLIVITQPSWASLPSEFADVSAEPPSADYSYQETHKPTIEVIFLSDEELSKIDPNEYIGEVYSIDTTASEASHYRIASAGKKIAVPARSAAQSRPKPRLAPKATPTPQPPPPQASEDNCEERGVATMYGRKDGFHGRKTAFGQRFSQYGKTAAHPKLGNGQRVRVTNRETGQSVDVTITDRGPYGPPKKLKDGTVEERIIDLAAAAGDAIGLNNGWARVIVRCL